MPNAWPSQLIATGVIHIFTLLFVSGRLLVAVRNCRLRLEDNFVAIAWSFSIIQWTLSIAAYRVYDLDIPYSRNIFFASSLFYAPAITFVKASAVCMFFGLKCDRFRQTLLYTLVLLQILPSSISMVFELARCRPLAYNWAPDHHPTGTCVRDKATLSVYYIEASTGVVTSLVLVACATIISKKIWSELREKIGLALTAAFGTFFLGILSIAANLRRTTLLHETSLIHTTVKDPTTLSVVLWALLEQQACIIALCLPILIPFFQTRLHRFSLQSTDGDQTPHFNRLSQDTHSRPRRRKRAPEPRPRRTSLPFIPTPALKTTIANIARERQTPSPLPPLNRSSETIWPTPDYMGVMGSRDEVTRSGSSLGVSREENLARQMMMEEGGILLTTEFQIRSEVVSRMPSRDDLLRGESGRVEV